MSTVVNKIGGIIRNAFDPRKMEEWQEYFQRWTMTGDDRLNCYGIDEKNHEAEQWFQKNIFSTVKQCLGDDKMRSIFGMYTESVKPYVIHSDEYHVAKNNKIGKPFKSWLIPYKVDGSRTDISAASTIIFNEIEYGDDRNSIGDSLRQKYFTHCDQTLLKKVSIYEILHWEPGSLIYWDQRYLHCSGSFNCFKTKEMFVGHTFIPD
jgi:hypothetical protein